MFKLKKEIKSKNGIVHFRRWSIMSTKWFNIYIHCIYKPDEDKNLHDHPWDFCSIILKGTYTEQISVINDEDILLKIPSKYLPTKKINRHPFSIVYRKSHVPHKILHILNSKPVWTLVITNTKNREWGYIGDNGWINHLEYRKEKNEKNNFPGCIKL